MSDNPRELHEIQLKADNITNEVSFLLYFV